MERHDLYDEEAMRLFKRNPPSAAVNVLRVELTKAEMRIDYLEHMLSHLRTENDALKKSIDRFIDEVKLVPQEDGGYCFVMHSCDVWDALEILLGQR